MESSDSYTGIVGRVGVIRTINVLPFSILITSKKEEGGETRSKMAQATMLKERGSEKKREKISGIPLGVLSIKPPLRGIANTGNEKRERRLQRGGGRTCDKVKFL